MRFALVVASLGALLATGCFKLDPFLYTPGRTDRYAFEPEGKTPEETITEDRIERLTIPVNEEISLGAVLVHAEEQPARAQVIFFHGKGGTLDNAFARIKRLSNLGYDVLGFDYRGWGMSTNVTPSEAGIAEDTAAVLAWFRERIGATTPIVYYGQSFGTATATQRAELDPPAALILESGFASIHEFEVDSTQLMLPSEFIAHDTWATSERIANVHAPVLMLHGLADDFVRPEFSVTLHENANEPKRLVLVEGADHGNIPTIMGDEYGALIQAFVEDPEGVATED